jgi:hypothetical protein
MNSEIVVRTQNKQEPEAPTQNWANQTIRYGKQDDSVSSAPTAIRGTVGSSEGVIFLAKWRLTKIGSRSMIVAAVKRSNRRKNEKNRKPDQKCKEE